MQRVCDGNSRLRDAPSQEQARLLEDVRLYRNVPEPQTLRSLISVSKVCWRNMHVLDPETGHGEPRVKQYSLLSLELLGSSLIDPSGRIIDLCPLNCSITTLRQPQRTHGANFILVSRPVSISPHDRDH